VGRCNGVEVTRKMQVDILHRNDLGVSAAGGAALHAETRPKRRFANTDGRAFADMIEAIAKPNRRRRLAFTCRGRRDRRHKNEFSVRIGFRRIDMVERDFRFVRTVLQELIGRNIQLRSDLRDGLHGRLAGDLDITLGRGHFAPSP